MSNETPLIERVRAVLVALAMVLSVVGGAAAIAGPSLADGSLQDDGTTGNVASDEGAGDGTDDVGDSAETTVDDGDSGPTVEDTTEAVDDTTESPRDQRRVDLSGQVVPDRLPHRRQPALLDGRNLASDLSECEFTRDPRRTCNTEDFQQRPTILVSDIPAFMPVGHDTTGLWDDQRIKTCPALTRMI
jgi:hypothetical protein